MLKYIRIYAGLWIWTCTGINQCLAELNDGHYDEEDDAKVLPIVLPIVLIVALVCIIACCWQGKKCPCNKSDDSKKKKTDNADSNSRDLASIEKGKQPVTKKPSTRQESTSPPPYSSVSGSRNKPLPGPHFTREEHQHDRSHSTTNHEGVSRYLKSDERYSGGYDNRLHKHRVSSGHRSQERSGNKMRAYSTRGTDDHQTDKRDHGRTAYR